ncbi:hypothetical protein [Maridesulfovibrio ferrireducens]|uniref:hypothetical protein n=1 Tax=Maridesulfovibrio ferrireducens TaxID=246191 RepID=UPI001A350806|nr:hypothetical protein [Maridesulfovibrio ferrireducens]MBI9112548.1 hypothetical protein [Maridesulfovibrio ferrireducens]
MKKTLLLIVAILALTVSTASGKESSSLNDLKRPEFNLRLPETTQKTTPGKKVIALNNSRFCGVFAGEVTVHYTNKMVTTTASLTINSDMQNINKSHYDYYVIPSDETFMEYEWNLDKMKVRRSVTVSGNTFYITDIIDYEKSGGNSQIRTLVFSPDLSALTFLKTEFDDSKSMSATGQIIGRFNRTK